MKTLVFEFKTPTPGDLIVIEYASSRGGCTSVKHRVQGARQRAQTDAAGIVTASETLPADTGRDIAQALAGQIRKDWMNEAFEARPGNTGALIVGCTGLVQDVTFKAFVEGHGTTITTAEF